MLWVAVTYLTWPMAIVLPKIITWKANINISILNNYRNWMWGGNQLLSKYNSLLYLASLFYRLRFCVCHILVYTKLLSMFTYYIQAPSYANLKVMWFLLVVNSLSNWMLFLQVVQNSMDNWICSFLVYVKWTLDACPDHQIFNHNPEFKIRVKGAK